VLLRAGGPRRQDLGRRRRGVGFYPIVTFQYSSATFYQVPYHIQYLLS
jgi:hypothetical protein